MPLAYSTGSGPILFAIPLGLFQLENQIAYG